MADAAAGEGATKQGWLKRHLPTRDTIDSYRLLRPFARRLRHPSLWHMNHRSVPRAISLGLGIGIIMPFMHIPLAALLAIPARANVMIAAASTLVVNPLTIPPMYYAAYRIGRWELRHDAGVIDPTAAAAAGGELGKMLFWAHHASGPIALGILTMAASAAALGYAVAAISWRMRVKARWRRRRRAHGG